MTSVQPNLEEWFPKLQEILVQEVQVRPTFEVWPSTSLIEEVPTTALTHDAALSDLWDYYQMQIHDGRMSRDKIAARECNQRCRHIPFVYPASVIHRHPRHLAFGRRIMQLEYRYCKSCSILIPKSIILELDDIRAAKRRGATWNNSVRWQPRERTENMPVKCPCCAMKTAVAKVLIRRTKMGEELFKDEGY